MRVARATDQPDVTKWTFCAVEAARGDTLLSFSFCIFSCLFSALTFITQSIQPWPVNVVGNRLETWGIEVSQFPQGHSESPWWKTGDTWHPELCFHDRLSPHSCKNLDTIRLFERPSGRPHLLLCLPVVLWWLMDHRHLDPSITFIWSLSSSVVTENCCYPKALQRPALQELNTWTQSGFSSMDVISKLTGSTDSAETLISTHEMERQLRLDRTLYFWKLPSPTPHISVFAQLPSRSVKGFHCFYNFMHYCSCAYF